MSNHNMAETIAQEHIVSTLDLSEGRISGTFNLNRRVYSIDAISKPQAGCIILLGSINEASNDEEIALQNTNFVFTSSDTEFNNFMGFLNLDTDGSINVLDKSSGKSFKLSLEGKSLSISITEPSTYTTSAA